MRKHILIALLVLTVSTVTAANSSDPSGGLEISFSHGNGTCGSPGNDTVNFDSVKEDEMISVTVQGTVNTPNPCYSLEQNVEQLENKYVLNISSRTEKRVCVQCTGSIDYTAEVSIPENTSLEVIHDGEQKGSFTHEPSDSDNKSEPRGLLARIMAFFGF